MFFKTNIFLYIVTSRPMEARQWQLHRLKPNNQHNFWRIFPRRFYSTRSDEIKSLFQICIKYTVDKCARVFTLIKNRCVTEPSSSGRDKLSPLETAATVEKGSVEMKEETEETEEAGVCRRMRAEQPTCSSGMVSYFLTTCRCILWIRAGLWSSSPLQTCRLSWLSIRETARKQFTRFLKASCVHGLFLWRRFGDFNITWSSCVGFFGSTLVIIKAPFAFVLSSLSLSGPPLINVLSTERLCILECGLSFCSQSCVSC